MMNTSTNPKRDSQVLGLVAICALGACVMGAHFTAAAQSEVIGINGHTTSVTPVVTTTTFSNNTVSIPTAVPANTNVPVTNSVPAGMTAYVDSNLPYSLDYPNAWTTSSSAASGVTYFRAAAPDGNAEVFVGAQASNYLDTAGLQTQLETNVNALVTSAGFTAGSTPKYASGSVNGVPTQGATITIESSTGATGAVAAAVAYYKGEMYFVVGVVNDDSAAGASQDAAQLQSIANSFSLR
jgi:hypothetical protein